LGRLSPLLPLGAGALAETSQPQHPLVAPVDVVDAGIGFHALQLESLADCGNAKGAGRIQDMGIVENKEELLSVEIALYPFACCGGW